MILWAFIRSHDSFQHFKCGFEIRTWSVNHNNSRQGPPPPFSNPLSFSPPPPLNFSPEKKKKKKRKKPMDSTPLWFEGRGGLNQSEPAIWAQAISCSNGSLLVRDPRILFADCVRRLIPMGGDGDPSTPQKNGCR